MENLKIINYSLNGQLITAGYGKQSKGGGDYGSRRLKFARFNMSLYDLTGIQYKSKNAKTCSGQS